MAKEEFKWDTEEDIATIEVNERERRQVSYTTLGEKQYVVVSTEKFFKKKGEPEETWRVVKNATFPYEVWFQITDAVDTFVNKPVAPKTPLKRKKK